MNLERILAYTALFVLSSTAVSAFSNSQILKATLSSALVILSSLRLFKRRDKRRRLSVHSACMANGAFPTECHVPEPVINAVLYFEEAPSLTTFRRLLEDHFLKYERFRSIFVPGMDDELVAQPVDVDVGRHLFLHDVSDNVQAHRKLNSLVNHPSFFHPQSPRWEFHFIRNAAAAGTYPPDDVAAIHPTNVNPHIISHVPTTDDTTTDNFVSSTPGEAHVLILRICHSLGDGLAIVTTLSDITTTADGVCFAKVLPRFDRIPSPKRNAFSLAAAAVASIAKIAALPAGPFDTPNVLTHAPRSFGASPQAGLVRYRHGRAMMVVPPVSLGVIKGLKDAANATVNDIMMAATAGAIRRHALAEKDPAFLRKGKLLFRALMPIAFPRPASAGVTNKWAFLSASMPVELPTVRERLLAVTRTTSALKNSPEGLVSLKIGNLVNTVLPTSMTRKTVGDLFSRHSLVFSNVPGPSSPGYIGGKRVLAVHFAYPNLISQCGILSYDGRVYMNFTLDPDLVPNARGLTMRMIDELKDMCREYGVDWQEA